MTIVRKIDWWEVAQPVNGLETGMHHEVHVQREAIPLVFVPGIMGSRLRRVGAAPTADGEDGTTGPDGLPNIRWDPGTITKHVWMAKNFMYRHAPHRKRMIIGPVFDENYLEVANAEPVGDGLAGIMEDYRGFLEQLRSRDWGALGRIFEFPVYAFGYNWTASAETAGRKLKSRIEEIIAEARATVGRCDKVILVSHSMGGLVSRACCSLAGGEGLVHGIVHGVQPVAGSAAAYWRIKAGFEGDWKGSAVLGNEGPDVTIVLGNSPGGLQLLPNRQYRTNDGKAAWLRVTKDGAVYDGIELPRSDPYEEIYRVPAVVVPKTKDEPSGNAYWGLVDPELLAPGQSQAPAPAGSLDAASDAGEVTPWSRYAGERGYLNVAKDFHARLGDYAHPTTFCFSGRGHATADRIELKVEWRATPIRNYRTRGFAGEFVTADGWDMKAILQPPGGAGDGTVPLSSARFLERNGKPKPGDVVLPLQHQPAYEDGSAQTYTIEAIKAICLKLYKSRRGGK